ncbi:hypothetical protein GN958_ATG18432 [Phytophthora infestans]|uniref:Uncharacterized protein n=1 Tax=Phytophthora infestans TaxID=4787 RepID=A0A8S9TTZ6_PHYIN|nr:hypothetical protein GN958_ATG18432 [Phytophthora infestans]
MLMSGGKTSKATHHLNKAHGIGSDKTASELELVHEPRVVAAGGHLGCARRREGLVSLGHRRSAVWQEKGLAPDFCLLTRGCDALLDKSLMFFFMKRLSLLELGLMLSDAVRLRRHMSVRYPQLFAVDAVVLRQLDDGRPSFVVKHYGVEDTASFKMLEVWV